jgi:hypothetical protein
MYTHGAIIRIRLSFYEIPGHFLFLMKKNGISEFILFISGSVLLQIFLKFFISNFRHVLDIVCFLWFILRGANVSEHFVSSLFVGE